MLLNSEIPVKTILVISHREEYHLIHAKENIPDPNRNVTLKCTSIISFSSNVFLYAMLMTNELLC